MIRQLSYKKRGPFLKGAVFKEGEWGLFLKEKQV
jgi:hypothetical protein